MSTALRQQKRLHKMRFALRQWGLLWPRTFAIKNSHRKRLDDSALEALYCCVEKFLERQFHSANNVRKNKKRKMLKWLHYKEAWPLCGFTAKGEAAPLLEIDDIPAVFHPLEMDLMPAMKRFNKKEKERQRQSRLLEKKHDEKMRLLEEEYFQHEIYCQEMEMECL
jgi:hypothetical protein